MTEGRRWLTEALAASAGAQPAVLAKAHFAAGFAALGQGDYPEARPAFERSLTLAREAGEVRLEAQALQQLGWLVMTAGGYETDHAERARELAGKALELAQSIGDKLVQSGALNILAEAAGRGRRRRGRERALRAEPRAAARARRQAADRELRAHARASRAHAREHRARGDPVRGGAQARPRARRHVERVARADQPRPAGAASTATCPRRRALFGGGAGARERARRQARRRRVPAGARRRQRGCSAKACRRRGCSARPRRCSSRSARRPPRSRWR